MKKIISVAVMAMSGCISICSAAPVESFALPAMGVPATLERIQSQELAPAEVAAPVPVAVPSPVLVVKGTINGDSQTFIISGNKLVCGFSDNKTLLHPETGGLIPAREMYLDSIFNAWLQTGDIRVACPSSVQHVCTAGVIYNCTHTIVPNSHQESRPCNATEINNYTCPSDGMVWVTVNVDECHVSCDETSKPCPH